MSASYNKYQKFVNHLASGAFNFASDNIKVALTNTAPDQTNNDALADITEISAGNGYSAGGTQATLVSSSQSGGTYKLVLNNVTFTASGSVGPFRYAVLYDSTPSGHYLIGYWDYGSSVTLANGDTFTVSFDGTNGVLQIA
jgi:hypothetical protein